MLVAVLIGPLVVALLEAALVAFPTGLPEGASSIKLVGVSTELVALATMLVGRSASELTLSSSLACTFSANAPSTFPLGE